MNVAKYRVVNDCEYNSYLLLKDEVVYLSAPYNFGKKKIFTADKKMIFFGNINENNFEYLIGQ